MDKFSAKNIEAYDKKADDYDNTYDGRFTEGFKQLLMDNISIKDGDWVLDVGCGNGTLLSRMAEQRSIEGFGTDISPQMIKNSTVRYPGLRFVVSDCERLPFDDNSMDIITVCAAYHHFPNVNAFAAEAKRLLKEGGSLYIAEIYLPFGIRHIANIFLPLSKDGDVKFYSPREITKTFAGVGLMPIKVMRKGHIQIVRLQNR
ncbi:MAG: class I SAM-dependent methyltransferase [Defluviitaleaceae bacterium]|nr:class I SAM-dependent methyltransferase [Defluviitaleaceae bacterium]